MTAIQANYTPFRPVQYLGSKLRVLEEIRSAVASLAPVGTRVADLFTGTTVVAQALAADGYQVTAVDTQKYAEMFGLALLGVNKGAHETAPSDIITNGLREKVSSVPKGIWASALAREDEALGRKDHSALRVLYDEIPLTWRNPSDTSWAPPITSVYAGTYFGIRQALTLDTILQIVENRLQKGSISPWQYTAFKTSLMHAASLAVHSAGKHFAQPLTRSTSSGTLLAGRIISDRKINIEQKFSDGCEAISLIHPDGSDGHSVKIGPAEEIIAQEDPHKLYYLDPPYTAQQYSRFYHILETLADDGIPKLPKDTPASTGLYPEKRYKSAFSARSKAPAAFDKLISNIASQGASAVISYSASSAESNGNARMITLNEIIEICNNRFGKKNVECATMAHRYRQFNSSGKSNKSRDDKELLILCKSA
ncbi:DNA adenine methylase (plasmid) [Acetobacter orientalis]|uniref:DNA adenine methylase n=1 Tax=Acetobacter orientalis TaxID=146474 RepID=UPI00386BE5DC